MLRAKMLTSYFTNEYIDGGNILIKIKFREDASDEKIYKAYLKEFAQEQKRAKVEDKELYQYGKEHVVARVKEYIQQKNKLENQRQYSQSLRNNQKQRHAEYLKMCMDNSEFVCKLHSEEGATIELKQFAYSEYVAVCVTNPKYTGTATVMKHKGKKSLRIENVSTDLEYIDLTDELYAQLKGD